MTFRDEMLQLADAVRTDAVDFGTRNYTIVIRTEAYSSEEQLDSPTTSDLTLSPTPRVRERAMGRELLVGPISPSNTAGGGYTPAQLNPLPSVDGTKKVTYRVTGDNGTRTYVLTDIATDKGYSYMLRLIETEHDGPH